MLDIKKIIFMKDSAHVYFQSGALFIDLLNLIGYIIMYNKYVPYEHYKEALIQTDHSFNRYSMHLYVMNK